MMLFDTYYYLGLLTPQQIEGLPADALSYWGPQIGEMEFYRKAWSVENETVEDDDLYDAACVGSCIKCSREIEEQESFILIGSQHLLQSSRDEFLHISCAVQVLLDLGAEIRSAQNDDKFPELGKNLLMK